MSWFFFFVDFVNFFFGDRVNIIDTAQFPVYTKQ